LQEIGVESCTAVRDDGRKDGTKEQPVAYDHKPGERRSPIKRKPLPGAGDSLRREIVDSTDDTMAYLIVATLLVTLAVMHWIWILTKSAPSPWLFTLFALVAAVLCAVKIVRFRRRAKRLIQAREGERAVAQHLESELRREGYEVFHDIPGSGFNVDHLVVGPTGVFAIETKTYSKPVGRESRVAWGGGGVMVDGRRPSRCPVRQARATAQWVRGLLAETTGKPIAVQPVVIFPGWFVEPMPRDCDVWVLNEKPAVTFIRNGRGHLDETTRAQVCGQIRQYLSRQS
jgi:hypothetical protein